MNTTTDGVVYAVGFNGYGQLKKDSPRIINRFIELFDFKQESVILVPLWSRILVAKETSLIIVSGTFEEKREIGFKSRIKSLAANEDFCLILLENSELWRIHLNGDYHTRKLIVFTTECGVDNHQEGREVPLFITSTLRGFYATTNQSSVYCLPTKIGRLPRGKQVVKLVSGYEHCLALLDNGDVFAWGGGLKGQLGVGELGDAGEPRLIEALSGIKIIEVTAGGWHSCAISEFGDLYVWGWNKHGQLGIPVKQNKSIYLLPEIVDVIPQESEDPEEIQSIGCGSSHTIIYTASKKLYGTGNCAFGQLSHISSPGGFIDQFTHVTAAPMYPSATRHVNLICGSMSSFLTQL